MPIENVPLKNIIIDEGFQTREKLVDRRTVNRYRGALKAAISDESGPALPPVTLAKLRDKLILIDGFHRLAAHRTERWSTIRANIIQYTTLEQMLWEAAAANIHHGKPLTNREQQEAFRRFVKAKRHHRADPAASDECKRQRPSPDIMTLHEIAKVFGKSPSTIHAWFKKADRREYNRLYRRDTGPSNAGGDRPAAELYREPDTDDLMALALENVEKHLLSLSDERELTNALRTLQCSAVRIAQKLGPERTRKILNDGWPEGWIEPEKWLPKPKSATDT